MESVCDTMSHQLSIPLVEDFAEFLGEFVVAGQGDVFGDGHGGGGDVAGDAGHGVGVATQRDGTDDGVHERFCFEEADDGFGHALVAGGLESIVRTYLVGGSMEIVAEGL